MSRVQHLKAQLIRARLSSDDFREAEEYLGKVTNATDDVVKRALLTAAIVSYCRPFTNNSKGSAQNATSTLGDNSRRPLTGEEQALHVKVMNLRNEAVAHTEFDRKPVKRLQGTESGFTMSGKLFDLLAENIDVGMLAKMCEVLQGGCVSKMLDLNREIVALESQS